MKITVEVNPQELRELLSGNMIPTPVRSHRQATTKEIRQWAKENGIPVAKGGTLPGDVIEAFYRHNGEGY